MALIFNAGGGGGSNFKKVPAGTHVAVCNLIADLGLQPTVGQYADQGPKRKVAIRWEIPSERVEYEKDGRKVEGPQTITRTFTASMHEKATLRKFVEAWIGKKLTEDQLKSFDIAKVLLGRPCLLNITETERGGETYTNVDNASPLIKGMDAPKAENPLIEYSDDEPQNFDFLPKRLKEKVEARLDRRGTADAHDEALAASYSDPLDF